MEGGLKVISFGLSNLIYLAANATDETPSVVDRIFGLDFQLVADVLVHLLVVFFLFLALSYFLFNPARKLMQARQQKIQDEMDFSAKEKTDAIQLKKEYTAKLKDAEKEVDTILGDARKKALKQETAIVDDAKVEASRIIERANQEAELEKSKVRDEMKKEIIDVASVMAGKIIAEAVDPAKQAQLIDDTLNEMGEGTWQK